MSHKKAYVMVLAKFVSHLIKHSDVCDPELALVEWGAVVQYISSSDVSSECPLPACRMCRID